jgi:hypothetical protein
VGVEGQDGEEADSLQLVGRNRDTRNRTGRDANSICWADLDVDPIFYAFMAK